MWPFPPGRCFRAECVEEFDAIGARCIHVERAGIEVNRRLNDLAWLHNDGRSCLSLAAPRTQEITASRNLLGFRARAQVEDRALAFCIRLGCDQLVGDTVAVLYRPAFGVGGGGENGAGAEDQIDFDFLTGRNHALLNDRGILGAPYRRDRTSADEGGQYAATLNHAVAGGDGQAGILHGQGVVRRVLRGNGDFSCIEDCLDLRDTIVRHQDRLLYDDVAQARFCEIPARREMGVADAIIDPGFSLFGWITILSKGQEFPFYGLIARHRRAVFGKPRDADEVPFHFGRLGHCGALLLV